MKGGEIGLRIRGGKKRWSLIYYLMRLRLPRRLNGPPTNAPAYRLSMAIATDLIRGLIRRLGEGLEIAICILSGD